MQTNQSLVAHSSIQQDPDSKVKRSIVDDIKEQIVDFRENEELSKQNGNIDGANAFSYCRIYLEELLRRHGHNFPAVLDH